MPWRMFHKAQVLKSSNAQITHKEESLNPNFEFLINHSNLTKRCWGELTKALGMSIFVGRTSSLQRREGWIFYTYPPKTSHWKLASKNWNIWFWNRNIQNLKYSCYRQYRTLRFGKPDCLIFPGSVRCIVYEAIVFHSSHLGF
jgi:hypothetical protein